jgi:hypothetical protein
MNYEGNLMNLREKGSVTMIFFTIVLVMPFLPYSAYSVIGSESTLEPVFTHHFRVYDYKDNLWWSIPSSIPQRTYYMLRDDPISSQMVSISKDKNGTQHGLEVALGTWPMLKPLADDLRKISGPNDELFVNLVLQVVHQMNYTTTEYIKFPVVTLVEGQGDCKHRSILAAAIMKAGGLASSVIIGSVDLKPCTGAGFYSGDCGPERHAMVGVHLSEPLAEVAIYHNRLPLYTFHNVKYYLAEATWHWSKPPLTNYNAYAVTAGSVVGENPLGIHDLDLIVDTPTYNAESLLIQLRVINP